MMDIPFVIMKESNKIIIGIVGEMGSGKSTVSKIIQDEYGASKYKFSDILREILELLHLPLSRLNLIDLFLILAERFGEDVLARPILKAIEKDSHDFIVIEGIRRPADISLLKPLPNFHLLGIMSDEQSRFQRIIHRTENSDDTTKTFSEFQKDQERKTETLITSMINNSSHQIINNGTIEELRIKVKNLIEKEIKTQSNEKIR